MPEKNHLFFGDLHNHNALGYGLGSLERSIDIARSHLDFFAFTGHASWHDIPKMEGDRQQNWFRGFEILANAWPKVVQLTAEANQDGIFSAFLGYEWHSSAFGDHCVVFPEDNRPLVLPDHLSQLRTFCDSENALMIPHHLAYPTGGRGVNWDVFDPLCTPVVEIFSEHGNAESDRGPFPYFNHSMGGRVSENTAQAALRKGLEFGFVASSDNHRGFPGGFGEGLVAVWAQDLNRAAIIQAIRDRRTYAITGDRIEIQMHVDGNPMGSIVRTGKTAEVTFKVKAPDELEVVEVIQGGKVIHRAYPGTTETIDAASTPDHIRLEWGWGPWADLDLDRVCDWRFDVSISNGQIVNVIPCFQSGPFDETRRHRIFRSAPDSIRIVSFSSRKGGYRGNPNQSVVLAINAEPDAMLNLLVHEPKTESVQVAVRDLVNSSRFVATGPFPSESMLFHRLVSSDGSQVSGQISVDLQPGRDFIYLRVRERNGQMAWTSPVFVNRTSG